MAMALTYAGAVERLRGSNPHGIKLGLEREEALLEALGGPHRGHVGVLVAGTNGKGSVCALVDSICRAAGLRVVLLVKPHLRSYCERVVVDGVPLPEAAFATHAARVFEAADALAPVTGAATQFEVLTAIGASVAEEVRPDVLVCEVGMGGRLDANNVFDLGVSVVTNVALDHERYLGETILAIAMEKAAIIKRGNSAVTAATGEALEVISARSREVGSELVVIGRDVHLDVIDHGLEGLDVVFDQGRRLHTPLAGAHQAANLAVAVAACEALRGRGVAIDEAAISRGAGLVRWPGRLQLLPGDPPLLLDGAHNPAALDALARAVAALPASQRPVAVVFGMMSDRAVESMLAPIASLHVPVVFTRASTARAVEASELARCWGPDAIVADDPRAALALAATVASGRGNVLVCGSLHLVGDVLEAVMAPAA